MTLKIKTVLLSLGLVSASVQGQGFYDIDTGAGLHDAIDSAIADSGVELVVLGEEIHASKGFYELKAKAIKELIQHHGFRRLAFEDNPLNIAHIDRYLQSGQGDLKSLMTAKLYKVWQAQSIFDLFRWLRKWNERAKNPDDRIRLYGFDIQGDSSLDTILKGVASPGAEVKAHLLAAKWRTLFQTAKTGPARQKHRDQGMAEVLLYHNKTPSYAGKTIVWTANGHGAKSTPGAKGLKNMGQYLFEAYGDKSRFYHIVADKIQVPPFWQKYNVKSPGSLSHWLKTFNNKAFFLNFRQVSRSTFGLKPDDPSTPYDFIDGAFYLPHSPPIGSIQ